MDAKDLARKLFDSVADLLRRNLEPIVSRLKAVEARIEASHHDRLALSERVRMLEERQERMFSFKRPSGRSVLKFRLTDGRVAGVVTDIGEEFEIDPPKLTIDHEPASPHDSIRR